MQTQPSMMKHKPRLGSFYVIQPGNGSGLFYSSQGPHGGGMCIETGSNEYHTNSQSDPE